MKITRLGQFTGRLKGDIYMAYNIGTVSPVAIAGMVFSLVIAVGLPIALCVIVKKKLGAALSSVLTGAAVFAVFVLGLESVMHRFVLQSAAGAAITGNVWLYALYGGVAAAVFEELGRFVAMKWCMKNTLNRENAVMYGVGHGGLEAMFLIGSAYISNLAASAMINSGALAAQLSALDAATAEATLTQLAPLWETAPGAFFLGGVERISAIALHICLSYLVYRAVRYGEGRYFALALALHFAVDAVTVLLNSFLSPVLLEVVLLVAVGAIAVFTLRLYRAEASPASVDEEE